MKKSQILFTLSIILMCMTFQTAKADLKPTKIYMFGFSASFRDSTVYFTDIQEVDSAWYFTKSRFLYGRDSYAYQLKEYMKQNGSTTPTCVLCFAVNKKDAEKKWAKMRKRYTEKIKGYLVKDINSNDFQFEAVTAEYDEEALAAESKETIARLKQEKKDAKKAQKEEKRAKKVEEKRQKAIREAGRTKKNQ